MYRRFLAPIRPCFVMTSGTAQPASILYTVSHANTLNLKEISASSWRAVAASISSLRIMVEWLGGSKDNAEQLLWLVAGSGRQERRKEERKGVCVFVCARVSKG